MSKSEIKFGTDGWRAIIADDFTFDNVRACAQGVAELLRENGAAARGLVVGYDTRFGSDRFAEAVAEIVSSNGIKVYLCDSACPTPTVSYNIVHRNAGGAVVITASHNPGTYNGFKYKPDYAGSASPEVVAQLEKHIAEAQRAGSRATGRSAPIETIDAAGPYLDHVRSLVDLEAIRRAPLKIAVDSMYGAGAGFLVQLLEGSNGVRVELHGERNPLFPGMQQPEPIALNLRDLSDTVRRMGADVGLATDGDADRLGVVDEKGVYVTQLQTIGLLALYLLDVRGDRGAIVKSVTTSSMLDRMGEQFRVPVFETPVGFKYIGPVMMRENALLAGEESGGYAFRGHIPERDGIVSGLYILALMAALNKKPSQLIQHLYSMVGPHHYDRIDLTFDPDQRATVLERVKSSIPDRLGGRSVDAVDTTDGFRFRLDDGSWALIRFSGTEPLLRIYCETKSEERVRELLEDARRLTGI